MSTYAIIKTGGKQYRVEEGSTLVVERLPVGDGDSVTLEPLLYVDGSSVVDGSDLAGVSVTARVVAHERGPKLRVVKFKPKRGYKRRTGHRQELTRLEITALGPASDQSSRGSRSAPKPVAAAGAERAAAPAESAAATSEPAAATPEPAATTPTEEADNGS